MKRIKNSLNSDLFPTDGETNELPSLTVPDQSMSVRELLERHTRGLGNTGVKVPMYDDEDELPDVRTLDLAELEELREQNREQMKLIRDNVQKQKVEDDEKRIAAEVEKRLAARSAVHAGD